MKIPVRTRIAACLAVVGLSMAVTVAQAKPSQSALPVEVQIPKLPAPVTVDGIQHLVYEIHVTNASTRDFALSGMEVLSDQTLASLSQAELEKITKMFGTAEDAPASTEIGAGKRIAVFMDVVLAPGAAIPRELRHNLTFSFKLPDGSSKSKGLASEVVPVRSAQTSQLQPPLRGSGWVAADVLDPSPNGSHRRSLMAVDGKLFIAQRYAIDWVRLGPDGRYFHDDPTDNRNWYDYGAEVLAVGDGVVSDVLDGMAENVAQSLPNGPVTLDNIAGNYLILDLGQGRYALYAHVQPGSIRVKLGDKVKAGQVLALLGNTGNSDAPHLHFHLVDGNSSLGAEGIAYGFASFKVHGKVEDAEAVFAGSKAWKAESEFKPQQRHGELPANYAVIEFP